MREGKIIKVCGMTDAENIRAVEMLGVDLMGFIFYPRSPRFVDVRPAYLPERARRVGVFVDASFDEIMRRRDGFGLDYVQLHGSEEPELCSRLRDEGLLVIKAFGIGADGSRLPGGEYGETCDLFLFDTLTSAYGGSGTSFDWDVLDGYGGPLPFLLSGGIGPDSIVDAKTVDNKYFAGLDLNSRFEVTPGIKDVFLLSGFINGLFRQRL